MSIHQDTDVTLVCTFKNALGQPINPTTTKMGVTSPAGATTIYTFGSSGTWTNPSTGVFTFELLLDQGGNWDFVVKGTGAVKTSGPMRINVTPSTVVVP